MNGFAPTTEDSREQALRGVRPDDVSHFSHYSFGVRPDRPEHIHTNRSDDLYPALEDSQAQSIVRDVRPDDFSHYSYGARPDSIHVDNFSHYSRGVRPDSVRTDDFSHYSRGVRPDNFHTNYANRPAHAESNESSYLLSPLETEDPQFAGTNCLFLFRAKEN